MKYSTACYLTLLLLTNTLILASCSWSGSNEQPNYIHASLAEGKANFKEKNYTLAYRQLLPLAVKGSPDAQYAIGYMYYYGKGIDRNEELAESWLRKAAKQGQSHAIQALKEFSKQPPQT
jgi:TPR repeat protein